MSSSSSSAPGAVRRPVFVGIVALALAYGAGAGTISLTSQHDSDRASGPSMALSPQPGNMVPRASSNATVANNAPSSSTTLPTTPTTVEASAASAAPVVPVVPTAGASPQGDQTGTAGTSAQSPVAPTKSVSLPSAVNQLPPGVKPPSPSSDPRQQTLSMTNPDEPTTTELVLTTIPVR